MLRNRATKSRGIAANLSRVFRLRAERLEDRRLLALTTLDNTFNYPQGKSSAEMYWNYFSSQIAQDMAILPDGKVLLAGTGGTMLMLNANGAAIQWIPVPGVVQSIHVGNGTGILVAGETWNGTDQDYFIAKYQLNGLPDPTFGDGGKLIVDIQDRNDTAYDVLTDTAGRIVVVGRSIAADGFSWGFVHRYLPNGMPDLNFGFDGRRTITFPHDNGFDSISTYFHSASLYGGALVVGGHAWTGSVHRMAVARFYDNGFLDTTFSGDGLAQYVVGGVTDIIHELTHDSSGRIVATGYSYQGSSTDHDMAVIRINGDGSLDNTFSGDGKVVTAVSPLHDRAFGMSLQPDGKILASGYATTAASTQFALVRYNTDGSLDGSFDGDGIRTLSVDTGNNDGAHHVAIKPNGTILQSGYAVDSAGNVNFAAAAYLPSGSLDTSFGNAGKTIHYLFSSHESSSAVAVQPDGKTIVVGSIYAGSNDAIVVTRFRSNGYLDFAFGNAGAKTIINWPGKFDNADYGTSVATLPDGRIYVGARSWEGGRWRMMIARLTESGSLDTTFDTDGIVTPSIGTGHEWINSLVVLPSGKLLAAGRTSNSGGSTSSFALIQYNLDGSLDTSFDGDGVQTFTFYGTAVEEALAVTVDMVGKIYVAGNAKNGTNGDAAIARLNPDGSFDTSFDGDGKVILTYGSGDDAAWALAVQPDNRLVVAGVAHAGTQRTFALARFLPDGSLDLSFDTDGKVLTAIGTLDDGATSVVIQPDLKIVAAGYTRGEKHFAIAIARYLPDGRPDLDFDGDGKRTESLGNAEDRAFGMALQSDGRLVVAGWSYSGQTDDIAILRYEETRPLQLAKDINENEALGYIEKMVEVNGVHFFTKHTPAYGAELWRTDGTAAGTRLVKDIIPGYAASSPKNLVAANGKLFFAADDGLEGETLWVSDGTPVGTHPVKSFNALHLDNTGIFPPFITRIGNLVYFTGADNSGNGYELWRSDGTDAGTYMVKNIRPGIYGSHVENLVEFNGIAYFAAWDGSTGPELWRSDGTAGGTYMVGDFEPGSSGISPDGFTIFNGRLYFRGWRSTTGNELWSTDGTAAGTSMVDIVPGSTGSSPYYLTVVGNALYFTAHSSATGYELWKSTGPGNATQVKDILPGSGSGSPSNLVSLGGSLYFSATDGAMGTELWTSDGTAAGTVPVLDINPGASSSQPRNLAVLGGMLLFSANNGTNGIELWRSDGTPAGTTQVKDINPGSGDAIAGSLDAIVAAGSLAYFGANDGQPGNELWRTDGTESGTQPVGSTGGTEGSSPQNLTAIGSTLFFTAFRPDTRIDLWKSDGTPEGTIMLKDFQPADGFSSPQRLLAVGNTLYFAATDGTSGRQLWKSDGTPAGTVQVSNISGGVSFEKFVRLNGNVLFSANDGVNGFELWISDGTAAGTQLLKDINPGSGHSAPSQFVVSGGAVYFSAGAPGAGTELWKTDGTAAGTVMVKDITPGTSGSFWQNMTAANGLVYFSMYTAATGIELWKSDGTEAGTAMVGDINPGSASSNPSNLFAHGSGVFFSAASGTYGTELWFSNGNSAWMVEDIRFGADNSSYPKNFAIANNKLFFNAETIYGQELWVRDLVWGQTYMVKDIYQYDEGSNPSVITSVGNKVYFTANDGISGEELWESDGTPWGTRQVDNLATGSGGSNPTAMQVAGTRLFVVASTNATGSELYSMDALAFQPDIVVQKFTADGQSTVTVQYNVLHRNAAPFELGFAKSADLWWSSEDQTLGSVQISDPADLTVGTHIKTFTIGTGVNQIPLPGVTGPDSNDDYRVLVIADPQNAVREFDGHHFNEDNAKPLVGVYKAAHGVFAFGNDAVSDTMTVTKSGTKYQLALGSTIYEYAVASVPAFRLRGAGGNDLITATNIQLPFGLFGGAGNDSLTGGSQADWLEGGAGNDTLTGGNGNDTYLFDADFLLGVDTLTDSGGLDTIDLSRTSAIKVALSLGVTTAQVVSSQLTLTLTSNAAIENLFGGGGNDQLTGNTLANLLEGGGGNDTLVGSSGNDIYRFDADAPLGTDSISDSAGTDTLDFSPTTVGVQVQLGVAAVQTVNTNLSLSLGNATAFENATGGSGSDVLTGNSANNTLQGNAGDDQLFGLTGNDIYLFDVDLSLGTDTVGDTGGNDTLDFSATTLVTLSVDLGQTGNQVVHSNLTLNLTSSNTMEAIRGGDQADVLTGNALENSFSGNGGNDTLAGGVGNDTYLYDTDLAQGADTIDESAGGVDLLNFGTTTTRSINVDLSVAGAQAVNSNLTLTLSAGDTMESVTGGKLNDLLIGNSLNNVLTGGIGNDTLEGAAGSDTLTGAAGNDLIIGGANDDTYLFDADAALGTDTLDESAGGVDTLNFATTTTKTVSLDLSNATSQVVNSNLTLVLQDGSTFENIVGGSKADMLTGNALNNVFTGGAGDDTLTGGAGDDVYLFDADIASGSDTLDESGGGIDRLDFTATTSQAITLDLGLAGAQVVSPFLTLTLTSGNTFENATGGSKNDLIRGNALNNSIIGGAGADILIGLAGNDSLTGGTGDDILIGGTGADLLLGESNDDLLISGMTSHDANNAALLAILNEWNGPNAYPVRVINLRTGVGGFSLNSGSTVFGDADADTLTGALNSDWFFATLADDIIDAGSGEVVDAL